MPRSREGQPWTQQNQGQKIILQSGKVLVWPQSDTAPDGWGKPFVVEGEPVNPPLGTVGGTDPNVALKYTSLIEPPGITRSVANSLAGNCYWKSDLGGVSRKVISWQGPLGFCVSAQPRFTGSGNFSTSNTVANQMLTAWDNAGYTNLIKLQIDVPGDPAGRITHVAYATRWSNALYKNGKILSTLAPGPIIGAGKISGKIVVACKMASKLSIYLLLGGAWSLIGDIPDPALDPDHYLLDPQDIMSFSASGMLCRTTRSVAWVEDVPGGTANFTSGIKTFTTQVTITELDGIYVLGYTHSGYDADPAVVHERVTTTNSYTAGPPAWDSSSSSVSSVLSFEGKQYFWRGYVGEELASVYAKFTEASNNVAQSKVVSIYADPLDPPSDSGSSDSLASGGYLRKAYLYLDVGGVETSLLQVYNGAYSTSFTETASYTTSTNTYSSDTNDAASAWYAYLLFLDPFNKSLAFRKDAYTTHTIGTVDGVYNDADPPPWHIDTTWDNYSDVVWSSKEYDNLQTLDSEGVLATFVELNDTGASSTQSDTSPAPLDTYDLTTVPSSVTDTDFTLPDLKVSVASVNAGAYWLDQASAISENIVGLVSTSFITTYADWDGSSYPTTLHYANNLPAGATPETLLGTVGLNPRLADIQGDKFISLM